MGMINDFRTGQLPVSDSSFPVKFDYKRALLVTTMSFERQEVKDEQMQQL